MTITSIISRLTNNFSSRFTSLFSKMLHLDFWKDLATKNEASHDTSYNLAPLVGALIGLALALVTILGRLIFPYRVIATLVVFVCYLFFGFANALYGLGISIGEAKINGSSTGRINIFGVIAIIIAIALWCTLVTCMRPARLCLSLMSAVAASRLSACIVAYIKDNHFGANAPNELSDFDTIDLVVALLCFAPWLLINLKVCLVNLVLGILAAICIATFAQKTRGEITEKNASFAIVVTEIFSLLIWLI